MCSTAIASSHQTFLTNALIPLTNNPNKFRSTRPTVSLYCTSLQHDHHQDKSPTRNNNHNNNENKFAKLAIIAVAAGMLTLGSVHDASAAKTGGRIGGQAFKSAPPRSSPRINNSRTNIYINPRVAPPLVGGYGYGYGVPYYGGWGWSPFSFFAPGPSVAVGVGGGFDTILLFMFLGAAAAVVRRFFGSRNDDDDDY
ncbi:hypothetical protein VNO78_22918 [Psophocarpus tetragonolobus]|uniref:Transmembrane protein n=1 Tax=Psophocarpus tetragonolobus TaxID=3891 RepID=A0AAN9S5Q9_PSOTE